MLLCGDWNARLGNSPHADINTNTIPGNDLDLGHLIGMHDINNDLSNYNYLTKRGILHRTTMDINTINHYGKQLFELCKTTQMIILNGRVGDDRNIGCFTRIDTTGKSLVDVAIARSIIDKIINFTIHPKFPESDHLPVVIDLNISHHDDSKENNKIHDYTYWSPKYKYSWDKEGVKNIPVILQDSISKVYYDKYLDNICSHVDTDIVARSFSDYLTQAYDRIFYTKKVKPRKSRSVWFDRECKDMRTKAVKAGERAITCDEQNYLINCCREYRACKQRKRRRYVANCLDQLEYVYKTNQSNLWKTVCSFYPSNTCNDNMPKNEEFYLHFKQNSMPRYNVQFDYEYEKTAIEFLKQEAILTLNPSQPVELDIMNRNFTYEEIETCIKSLKLNKSPGFDLIPAEFIKAHSAKMAQDLTILFNYIIEERVFPEFWCEGIRNPIFKKGNKSDPQNYRGITLLPVMEKIFELAVTRRIEFIDDAFLSSDRYNSGFKKGCRTTDNIFTIVGLIERQLVLGRGLIICFIDFSQAFDLVNRHILFYKIKKTGLKGRVIDTLQNLYTKTKFRLNVGGKLSGCIQETVGVNQGGNASPTLFKKYLADLENYLDAHTGISIGDELLMHGLWADDLYLVSDCSKNSQKQLDSVKAFCSPNQMIVNGIKTKCMIFGKINDVDLFYNDKLIENVNEYKYLGNIFNRIYRNESDLFRENTSYLISQARKAIFSIGQKLSSFADVPPKIKLHIFKTLIQPILLYGSDVWGCNHANTHALDKVLFEYLRCTLKVKMTTSNLITIGEFGVVPPSLLAKINVIIFCIRLQCAPDDSILKKVLIISKNMHGWGFKTWYGKVQKLAEHYDIDIQKLSYCEETKKIVKNKLKSAYIREWHSELENLEKNPILNLYGKIKDNFKMELYLTTPIKPKYRNAISKIRTSSHTLAIERGRYTTPKTPRNERLCVQCGVLEDEIHFLISCNLYEKERAILFRKITLIYEYFMGLNDSEKFVLLFKSEKTQVLSWLGRFIHKSLEKRIVEHSLFIPGKQ